MTGATAPARPLDDPRYTTPIYRRSEAAQLVGVRTNTFRNWANGYTIKRPSGRRTVSASLITTDPTVSGRKPSVPFVGVAESYVISAFRAAGVSMQRIRSAVEELERRFGLPQALASERLYTDGAEVLWNYGQQSDDPYDQKIVGGLVVLRNNQGVFREVIKGYLTQVTYEDGWAKLIRLPRYERADVTVDPRINGGAPTVARRGIRVADITDRWRAGESADDLAYDYELTKTEITAVLPHAA
ncbi:DUF433 domain-containing protein [Streptomonospora arabica]|uniref:DUF433 domain-containing protein n=1 Tax=Streptomonospora arabica TaxID=412417 RepID=A0ABV9SR20_9ACTN